MHTPSHWVQYLSKSGSHEHIHQIIKRIIKIPTVFIYHLQPLCVEGTRMSGSTRSIFLELIEVVSIIICMNFQKPTLKKIIVIKNSFNCHKKFVHIFPKPHGYNLYISIYISVKMDMERNILVAWINNEFLINRKVHEKPEIR